MAKSVKSAKDSGDAAGGTGPARLVRDGRSGKLGGSTGAEPDNVWRRAAGQASVPPDLPLQPGDMPPQKLTVAPDGRLLIPAALREAMLLGPDGCVTVRVEAGELRVIAPLAAIRRVQAMAAKLKQPGESVVDEFLAERRAMWGEE